MRPAALGMENQQRIRGTGQLLLGEFSALAQEQLRWPEFLLGTVLWIEPAPCLGDRNSAAKPRRDTSEVREHPIQQDAQHGERHVRDLRRPTQVDPRAQLELTRRDEQIISRPTKLLVARHVMQLPHQIHDHGE
jgi:hypothetical protein